ncbi:MAG: leucine-rich repeat protein [Oscillibacter sp.]|nr:leucine-rich repeat protein [Oscillibacter sp.]
MADVFISYHRSEGASALVRRIAGELESRGVTCWYDTKNAAPVDFIERTVTEIERCKVFLFLWDEQANEDSKKRNSYVRSEIQWAYGEKHIALFPFQVGNFEKNKTLRFYFGHINIPYGGDTPETAQTGKLVNAIADALDKTQPLSIITQPQIPLVKIIGSGQCGNHVAYILDENGLLSIAGIGPMWDYELDDKFFNVDEQETQHYRPWEMVREKISHIEIQNGVTTIGCTAFLDCKNLTSVSIPDSVTYIECMAFSFCDNLTSVSIPKTTKIHPLAFDHITRVTRREPADNQ